MYLQGKPTHKKKDLTDVLFEPLHDKTNKMACVPSKDSDQPGYLLSLIRAFTVHSMGSQGPNVSSCGQRRLTRLGGWRPRLIRVFAGRIVILLVLSSAGSFVFLSIQWGQFSYSLSEASSKLSAHVVNRLLCKNRKIIPPKFLSGKKFSKIQPSRF